MPGLQGGGWKRLTLGICIGPIPGMGYPGADPQWVLQSFTVPDGWSQQRMMAHVAAEWALDSLRPLYFEAAPLLSVMWGVDASQGVAPGAIHMNLNVLSLDVQPVTEDDPDMASHVVRTSGSCEDGVCADLPGAEGSGRDTDVDTVSDGEIAQSRGDNSQAEEAWNAESADAQPGRAWPAQRVSWPGELTRPEWD